MAAYPPHLYSALHVGVEGDLDFYIRAASGRKRVLELGCGFGRVLEALAAPERELVGLDIDAGLLELARRRLAASTEPSPITLTEGDMTTFSLEGTFDCILLPYSGIYCLLDEDAMLAMLRRVRAHLAPGGRFIFDAYEADEFHRGGGDGAWGDDDWAELTLIETSEGVYSVYERSRWDRGNQRIDVDYRHIPVGGGATVDTSIPQRYLLYDQLEPLLARADLELELLEQAFDGSPRTEDSENWVAVAVAVAG